MTTESGDRRKEKERILVVDDEKDVVTFCLRVLALEGYEGQGTCSALEALELAKQEDFDLLVTDIMMPEMSGLDLLAELRTTMPDMAAVIITGYGTIDMAIKALRAGARDFVTKPFTVQDLQTAIEHALRETRLLRENVRLRALVPLLQASQRFGSTVKLDQLLAQVLETTARQAGADHGCVLLMVGDDLEQEAAIGCEDRSGNETCACWALASSLKSSTETIVVTRESASYPQARQLLASAGVFSMLCLPLRVKDRVIGLLNLCKQSASDPFDQGDVEAISILGNQAAAAIENARLFGELERAQTELEQWNRELEERVEERTRELREAQEHLVRAERLAVIGKLGAGIAHELRNPLAVINNSAYYLGLKANRADPNADPKVKKHLAIIEREVARSNKIIADLMSFVRVTEFRTEMVDINALVEEALERVETPPTMAVETNLQEDLPKIIGDPGRIQQIFINLLTNAVQAISGEGTLGIATHLNNGFVQIAFSDTGCGLSPETKDRLFEPLFTTKAKGIGLGLAISKMLVERQGGHITAHNNVGEGATFVVALPTRNKNDAGGKRS